MTYGIWNQYKRCRAAPPCIITVIITINEVVVSIVCLASDKVFLIANANDIAPRNPEKLLNSKPRQVG